MLLKELILHVLATGDLQRVYLNWLALPWRGSYRIYPNLSYSVSVNCYFLRAIGDLAPPTRDIVHLAPQSGLLTDGAAGLHLASVDYASSPIFLLCLSGFLMARLHLVYLMTAPTVD